MPESKSISDSPLSEGKLWGNVSPKSRLNAYMPEKRKTIYKIPSGLDEEEMNARLLELETPDLPIAPSGLLFPDVPTGKLERKPPALVFPAVPTGPLSRKPQKLTALEQLYALERGKLTAKTRQQTKKNKSLREKFKSMLNRMTKSTFKKGGAKSVSTVSTFKKSGAKSKSRKSTFKKGGAKSKSRKSR